jgi:hypothetical protein
MAEELAERERQAYNLDRLQEAAGRVDLRDDDGSHWRDWFGAVADGFEEGRPDIYTARLLEEAWAIADALYALGRELNRRNPESTVASEVEDLAQRLDESKMGHPLAQIAKRSEDLDIAALGGES